MLTRTIAANGLDFEILEAGREHDNKLLLVHGFTGAKEDFDDHLDPLAARGWHVVAPDHRGHGRSAKPAGEDSYSMSLMADDMLAIVDGLGWRAFVLLGHSMGGMVAQIMTTQLDADRLRGLVLMDTSPVAPDGLDADTIELGKALVRERGLEFLVEMSKQPGPLDTPADQRVLATRPGYAERSEAKMRSISTDMWCAIVGEIVDQPDRCELLRNVGASTLVIVGEQDKPFLDQSERMAETLPNGRLAVIPDAGHSPQFEAPDAWFATLTTFLDGVGGAMTAFEGHGGELALAALRPFGVNEIFTLSGGHIFPIYDACVKHDVAIYDVRHEQTATFAAEAMAKLTRRPGVAVLTAGPGITNGISVITTAYFNGSPLVVIGGRAPQARSGAGSLQELDHVPIVASITKSAQTVTSTGDIAKLVNDAVVQATTPHRGPTFVDIPLDVFFGHGAGDAPAATPASGARPDDAKVVFAAQLLARAERPALVAGSDVYWDGAWDALQRAVEALRIPTFVNGLGRGCLPADHELAFARTRNVLKTADLVAVVGTPLDFRLSFGRFGDARVIHIVDVPESEAAHTQPAVSLAGDLATILDGLAAHRGDRVDHEPWIAELRETETARRVAEKVELDADSDPIHPARIYGELRKVLDRDAVVIGDGGDFVSYAGKLVDSYEPGRWLDPGPYGCLGTGMGYAMAARVAHPDKQVVLLSGDGAIGFNGMDVDSLVRHHLPVVIVVGNNGIWGLEKHPMQAIYGYDVAADLQPECRYDQVVDALGGAGELVTDPSEIGPALKRAFDAGVPYLVNVVTDPAVAYPRSSNLG